MRLPTPVISLDATSHLGDTLPDLSLLNKNVQPVCPA